MDKKGFWALLTSVSKARSLDKYTLWFANEGDSPNTIEIAMNASEAPELLLYKSTDGYNWELWGTTSTTALTHTMGVGEKMYIRGCGNTACGTSSAQNRFNITSPTSVHGNIQALLDSSEIGKDTVPTNYCFMALFNSCDGIISIDKGLLPYTTLTVGCYRGIFANLRNLTISPDGLLPATNLAIDCYRTLFYNCTGLTQVSFSTLNESLDIFGKSSGTMNLVSLIIYDPIPPTIASVFFAQISNCQIYVPDESVNLYKTANVWRSMENNIKPLSEKP